MTPQELLELSEHVTVYVHETAKQYPVGMAAVKKLRVSGVKIKWFTPNLEPRNAPEHYFRLYRRKSDLSSIVVRFEGRSVLSYKWELDEFLKDMLPIHYAKKNIQLIESL